MVRFMKNQARAFTLIELLVVIAIIGVLAGLLMPVLSKARERARQTHCENNLKEFSVGLMLYRQDKGDDQVPPWLSSLRPKYVNSTKTYLCKSDMSEGHDGSRPEVLPANYGDQFEETDEITVNGFPCSYLYQFCAAPCSWNKDSYVTLPENIANTWANVKKVQMEKGDAIHTEPYAQTFFPIVSCFNHWPEQSWSHIDEKGVKQTSGLMINLAYAGNVFRSSFAWDRPLSEQTYEP